MNVIIKKTSSKAMSSTYSNDIDYLDENSELKQQKKNYREKSDHTLEYNYETKGERYLEGYILTLHKSKYGDSKPTKQSINDILTGIINDYGSYRNETAHLLVHSINQSTATNLAFNGTDVDTFLILNTRLMLNTIKAKYYYTYKGLSDDIGYVYGVHHDRNNRHIHIILPNRTKQGNHISLSKSRKNWIDKRFRINPLTDIQEVLKQIDEHIKLNSLTPAYILKLYNNKIVGDRDRVLIRNPKQTLSILEKNGNLNTNIKKYLTTLSNIRNILLNGIISSIKQTINLSRKNKLSPIKELKKRKNLFTIAIDKYIKLYDNLVTWIATTLPNTSKILSETSIALTLYNSIKSIGTKKQHQTSQTSKPSKSATMVYNLGGIRHETPNDHVKNLITNNKRITDLFNKLLTQFDDYNLRQVEHETQLKPIINKIIFDRDTQQKPTISKQIQMKDSNERETSFGNA